MRLRARLNKSLVAFAALLIIGGVYVGLNIVIVLGVFLLIPGLLTTPKKQSPVPVSKSQQRQQGPQPRRTSRPPTQVAKTSYSEPAAMQAPAQASVSVPVPVTVPSVSQMSTGLAYSPSLFPTSIFPSLSLPPTYRQQSPETKEGKPAQRDELIELGVLVAVLRLVFG